MTTFDLLDDFEACLRYLEHGETSDSTGIEDELAVEYNNCEQCGVSMLVKNNNRYVCPNCGLLNDAVEVMDMSTIVSDLSYNTMSSGLRCVGNNSHRYQSMLRSQSSSDTSPETHVRSILFAYNFAIGKPGAISKDVLLTVCEQYKHIRSEGTIYRGSILKAILAAMTYYECVRRKMMFRPSDIYTWFDVDSQTYSKGDKKVRELLDHGFLSEDLREINIEDSYLCAYAQKIDLPETHITFLSELLATSARNKWLNPNAKASTRALCILHIYLVGTHHPLKPDEFRVVFKANYGTIRTIALDLLHVSDQIIPIFQAHNIPYEGIPANKEKTRKIVFKRRNKTGRIAIPSS